MDYNDENKQTGGQGPQRLRKSNAGLVKVGIVGLVAGLLGGGIAYGGASALNNNNNGDTSYKNGTTKVANVTVKSNSDATKAFSKVKGAVVSVVNMQKQSSSSDSEGLYGIFGGGSSSNSNGNNSDSSSSKSSLETASEGSGVVYKKSGNDAYIVTNNHVVSGSSALEIILSNGKKISGKLVGTDSTTDLAVIRVDAKYINTVAQFGDSTAIQAGQSVLAIGSPLGSQYATSVTEGIISAKKRTVPVEDESGNQTGDATVIQTDAAINPGNSGGALINLSGQVIGINSMKLASSSSGTSVEGIGFAIPSNEVVSIINQLITNGKVIRPALGVGLVDLSNVDSTSQKNTLKLPSSVTGGVVLVKIYNNSAAEKSGLKKYDVITEIDGTKVTSQADLRDVLYNHKIGDKVSVKYYRDGQQKTGTITLSESTSQLSSSSK
ncbi:MAG: trypsin-like peptidase domain-containing protein [Furfurilactobacillus sp.]|jgi:serine protease Do|uniref:Trypsin-like peptidase domain-containing protein n=1 Tax=Furfurilactobacillus milii TaxID=2888272 RepID=A0ABT6DF89_9LACO|nr:MULTISPECIES: trypsin-like peptidase domain-containing protein [Furfurilactobacillus]QLE67667.1 Serine protease DegP-HtrA do-like [Furfurilactobacillus rossiae]MCF6160481.1 trypsin-like peptidase domain-containing protein [Furfurilactobacillus milii]MCF6162713.1 trypsin-like peptidase domain-containing protein [Furfurilactobacillus milii]MCF6418278.1 trypsin-like peptidase domain-containing protein [Furfurilactobacillus milii]MCH4011796.1 trypsin-like peptidase domain-containing protein [Fu